MNNKGFTLIELLLTIALISVIMVIALFSIIGALNTSDEKSYELLKKSIITQVDDYIYECYNNLIECDGDYEWTISGNIKTTSFYLDVMKKYSYFSQEEYINPITNEDISSCLIINVTEDEKTKISVKLDDSKCKK